MKVLSKSLEETEKIAKDFLSNLPKNKSSQATVIGLFGDLGAGKTAFSQALGRQLGVVEFMTSPTFTIMKKYEIPTTPSSECHPSLNKEGISGFASLLHIDAYRLENSGELEVLGFKELLKDPKNLIVIEWPERVSDILPDDLIKTYFKFISENEREISLA